MLFGETPTLEFRHGIRSPYKHYVKLAPHLALKRGSQVSPAQLDGDFL